MFNLDPKKMEGMMKQLGISQENISASRVTIEKSDGNKIVIENPTVTKINARGHDSFQVSGDVSESSGISEEDIKTVMEKTNSDKNTAKKALEDANGDLAEAILNLSS